MNGRTKAEIEAAIRTSDELYQAARFLEKIEARIISAEDENGIPVMRYTHRRIRRLLVELLDLQGRS